jgi:UDP-N-acetylglucosamine diphosphorylase/glucosamine-1-phosphate N-acetyltransferase
MRICLFEDAHVAALEPISLSRPAFELRCGLTTLTQKQRRYFHNAGFGVLIRPELVPLYRREYPHLPINDSAWLTAEPVLLVNARWLPPGRKTELTVESSPFVALVDREIAYACLTPDMLRDLENDHWADQLNQLVGQLTQREAGGRLFRYLWEVVDQNAEQIDIDFRLFGNQCNTARPAALQLIGPSDQLHVDPTARIDPFVVADTSNGPVIIDRDVVITSFTRLEGPCYLAPRSQIFRANIRGGTAIGPNCRVGGEVEASIIHGNSNKYHEGFLGHSYIGEWVNIGAGCHTSDLRNDYGEVQVNVNGQLIPTGRNKVGCYLGDHTKVGLGSLINTGTSVGVFGNLLPAGSLLPKAAPSFCWVEHGRVVDRGNLENLFHTAARMMERRGEEFTSTHRDYFEALYHRLAATRRQTILEAERRQLRKSA